MTPKVLLQRAIEQANHCVRMVRARDMTNPTPCQEWNLKQLLNHMVYELMWLPEMVAGKTISEVGDHYDGDVIGDDPLSAWRHAETTALESARRAGEQGVAHLSYGDTPVGEYIGEVARDIIIHGWDVGKAMHCTVIIDPVVAQAMYDQMLPRIDEMRSSGLFGSPQVLDDDASIQAKLLALYGRSDGWTQ